MRGDRKSTEEHRAQVGISFHDDGASLMCRRDECQEVGYWWQRDLPYMCTPEVAVELRDRHLGGEDW